MCVCVCMRTHLCMCVCECMQVCDHACMHACECLYLCVRMYPYAYVFEQACYYITKLISELHHINDTATKRTHKSTRVVISDCFSISECLQQRVGFQNDIFHPLHTESHRTMLYHNSLKKSIYFHLLMIQSFFCVEIALDESMNT